MKEQLEKRMVELQQALEQSAANHNMIVGALSEARAMLAKAFEEEVKAKPIEGESNATG